MRTTNANHIMLAMAITLASTAGLAFGGPEPIPTQAGKAQPAAEAGTQRAVQDGTQPDQNGTADPQPESAEAGALGEGAEAAPAPKASVGAHTIARWMRSIGGRICMGPKIDRFTRVSRPNPSDVSQAWRVSAPAFTSARMSAPPKRARPAQATELPDEAATEQTLAVAAESAETPN